MGDARETFDKLTDAVNRHDIAGVAACYGPGAVVVTPEGKLEGREQAAANMAQFIEAFPDLQVTCWSKITSGDVVVDEWTFTGTHAGPLATPDGETIPPTGRTVSVRGMDLGVVEAGLVTSHRVYYDQLDVLTQLGLLDQAGAVA